MNTFLRNWKRLPFVLVGMLLGAMPTLAHEKWFTDEHVTYFPKPEVFTRVTPFGAGIFILATTVFIGLAIYEKKYKVSRHPGFLKRWLGDIHIHSKVILSVALGTMLMGAGLNKTFFVPNLALPDTMYGEFLALAQISLGSLFVFLSPLLAELGVALLLVYLAGFFAIPLQGMLEELMFLGVAVFFITSETERLPWKRWITPERERLGYHFLRVMVGVNFLVLSGVKWFRPDLMMQLIEQHHLNFMAGFGVTTAMFVFGTAVVETFVALALLLKIAMRPALIAAFMVFMLSIYVFGFRELLGHLPIKATLVILFILGDWKKGETRIVR